MGDDHGIKSDDINGNTLLTQPCWVSQHMAVARTAKMMMTIEPKSHINKLYKDLDRLRYPVSLCSQSGWTDRQDMKQNEWVLEVRQHAILI